MKRTVLIAVVLATALIAAGIAQAESLSYEPRSYSAQAETGKSVAVPFTVTVYGLSGPASVNFVDAVHGGNLPASWVSASPGNAEVSSGMPLARTNLAISVPANAVPGIYSGYVSSNITSGRADTGTGTYIRVTVAAPVPACTESPDIEVSSVSPDSVSVPSKRTVDFTIVGAIRNPSGCNNASLTYQLTDEYEIAGTSNSVSIGTDGRFNISIPIEASRHGKDRDGRTYTVTLSARNEAGTSNRSVSVNVMHDRR